MTVESNYAITISAITDYLKNLAPIFQPMTNKTKSNSTFYAQLVPPLNKVSRNSDWLIALFAPGLMIGWSYYFGTGLSTFENRSKLMQDLSRVAWWMQREDKSRSLH